MTHSKSRIVSAFAVAATIAVAGVAIGCAPTRIMTNAEIPAAKDLGDIMWSQANVADPAFKKIGAAAYTDADYVAFTTVAERLAVTVPKIKSSFSKGRDFDALADTLAAHANELSTAVAAKDPKAASTALVAMQTTCRSCHKRFR